MKPGTPPRMFVRTIASKLGMGLRRSMAVWGTVVAALAEAAPPAPASGIDPLHAPACLQALALLDAVAAAPHPGGQPDATRADDARVRARVVERQRFAAGVCLGIWTRQAPAATRSVQPPTVVSPVPGLVLRGPPSAVAQPAAAPGGPAVSPPAIASCTTGGCITTDGLWIPRASGALLGPEGVLTQPRPSPPSP